MIYFDHNASSPPLRSHYKKVFDRVSSIDANPSSIHQMGRRAKLALEESRETLASTLGAESKNILFCSCASEANNMALHYLKLRSLKKNKKACVLASKLDHPSLKAPLKSEAFDVTNMNLNSEGLIDQRQLEETLQGQKMFDFASLNFVNGETGLINPVYELARMIKTRNPNCHIHVDAVQALGKINLTQLHHSLIDSASFSAHKIGAFKGIGCFYGKKELLKKKLIPLIIGGSHESGLRAGTENLMGAISFAEACKEINLEAYALKLNPLREKLQSFIKQHPSFIELNTKPELCTANTFNIYSKKIPMEKLLLYFERKGFLLSTKSACSSGVSGPSETLLAMGYDEHRATNSFRLSLSSQNTLKEVESFCLALEELFKKHSQESL